MPRDTRSRVEDVQRQLESSVARIHEDIDLSEQARERMIREVYSKARSQVMADAEEEKQEILADLRAARKVAFAPPVLELNEGRRPDPAIVARWYHDEIEKMREIREPQELERLLQEALLVGNYCRCKAILVRAYELQLQGLVTQYFESFPEERDAWDNLVEASEAYNEWERGTQFFSAAHRLKPLEAYLA